MYIRYSWLGFVGICFKLYTVYPCTQVPVQRKAVASPARTAAALGVDSKKPSESISDKENQIVAETPPLPEGSSPNPDTPTEFGPVETKKEETKDDPDNKDNKDKKDTPPKPEVSRKDGYFLGISIVLTVSMFVFEWIMRWHYDLLIGPAYPKHISQTYLKPAFHRRSFALRPNQHWTAWWNSSASALAWMLMPGSETNGKSGTKGRWLSFSWTWILTRLGNLNIDRWDE